MSKEELLKYLIAEIDLIMHDKDYRFENANGTWYSRESCRDLTNEEVFEELRTELRQFADLEATLAEKDKAIENWQTIYESVVQTCHNDKEEIERLNKRLATQENTITNLVEDNRASQEWYRKQLEEKDKEIEYQESMKILAVENQNKKAIEQLEKVKSAFGLINSKLDKVETIKEYIHYIDHQINELKGKVE